MNSDEREPSTEQKSENETQNETETQAEAELTDQSRLLGISYLIHPVPMTAVLLLALNDHFLKSHFHSFVTGKLSDFAGLFFFPLFLSALFNLSWRIYDKRLHWIFEEQILLSIVLTDSIFILVKFVPVVTTLYLDFSKTIGFPSKVTADRSDLIALSVNLLTWKFVWTQLKKNHRPSIN